MRVDIVTIFPEVIEAGASYSIVKRAQEKGALQLAVHNLRDWAHDRHRSTDDEPFGPGAGMVMKPEPVFEAVEAIRGKRDAEVPAQRTLVLLMTPQGELFCQRMASELARESHLIMICGHYEGVDERIREHLVTRQISIGDYVLTGGELPALVVLDALARLIPGVLGADQSAVEESFAAGLLEYPQYTRPAEFRGWRAPEILLSGHHAEIAKWRRARSLERTLERRPDLLSRASLTDEDRGLLLRILAERTPTQDSSEEDSNARD
jgi:tRNA (guanine37-N1)-methyltransferase